MFYPVPVQTISPRLHCTHLHRISGKREYLIQIYEISIGFHCIIQLHRISGNWTIRFRSGNFLRALSQPLLSTLLTSIHDLNRFPGEFYACTRGHWSMQKITKLIFFNIQISCCKRFLLVTYLFSSVKLLDL